MYLIYNTLTKEFDHAEYKTDAEEQLKATEEWLKEQRAVGHRAYLYSSVKSIVIKEEVS